MKNLLGRILKKVLGNAISPAGANPPDATDAKPYAFLNSLGRGFARRAQVFLATGDDRQVLADLKASISNRNFHPGRTHPTSVTATNVFCFDLGGQPEVLARFAELRLVMGWGFSLQIPKGSEHMSAIPDVVRVLLSACCVNHSSTLQTPTSWDDLRKAVKILGGHDIDIILFCLPTERYSQRLIKLDRDKPDGLRNSFDTKIFVAALDRLGAKDRATVLSRWATMPFTAEPAFLPYLFQQGHETAATLRKNAAALLPQHDEADVTARAVDMLTAKKATARLFAVEALGAIASPTAQEALAAHKETEKSQSVLTTLDLFLAAPTAQADAVTNSPAIGGGYVDASGTHVPLPPEMDVVDDGSSPLDASFAAKFHPVEEKMRQDAEDKYNRLLAYRKEKGNNSNPPKKDIVAPIGDAWLKALNTPVSPDNALGRRYTPYVSYKYSDQINPIVEPVLDQIPLRRVIDLVCRNAYSLSSILDQRNEPLSQHVHAALSDGRVTFAQLVNIAKQNNVGFENSTPAEDRRPTNFKSAYLTHVISARRLYGGRAITPGIWQVAADHLPILIAALPPRGTDVNAAQRALGVIADFPSVPAELVQPLVFVAIDDRASLRIPAQKLLADVPGIDDQLIKNLTDKRQAVRANTARFLADRGAKTALPALIKRLKTEKSELARADMISAVTRLGGDTTPYLGRDALIKEAQGLVGKLPNAKLDWLPLSTAPQLCWADGSVADPVLLDAWLRLALKLKSPLGSPLFGLYFDQMTPDSVTAVADWVLNCWMSYDTDRPVGPAARAKAEEIAKRTMASKSSWMAMAGYSLEEMTEQILRDMNSGYPNSGADSKGILALTHRATPATAGPLIARYLKQHGKRVSQAKAMVETLYGMGSQDAVQVLVATATRFKQRSVRELAEQLVAELAEARGWSRDELADRSVPTGGFEDDGTLLLEVGEDAKPYLARLTSDLTVKLFNPQGKEVKSIPAGTDANTKEAKSLLSAAKKTIKTAQAQQQARLYDAMVSSRIWDRQTWQDDLTHHPIMQRLIERVIWRGLDSKGDMICGLRLTPEGEVLNAAGDDVDMAAISKIDVAHTANLSEDERQAWLDHLRDFEVKPLFAQVSRPVRTLTDAQKNDTRLLDREGWMMTTFKLRAAAKKAGFDRAPVGDGGGFDAYRKEFRSSEIWADLYFTGSHVGEEDIPAAIKYMQFTQINDQGGGRTLPLSKVPPLLLSEVWNDLHEIAKSGAFDEDWASKGLY
ncbi:DUF4132 domain-containing protein [uncultured Tateyamaria sp.]|uniref:DUF4132 domain-containing protein n=1 Tax=uncultured Tateyamaria sp. TaxID=455651 RepID=UPI00262554C8|nr:DUF4132 domain-containing protein [uncultured Tateyamaria sp.]